MAVLRVAHVWGDRLLDVRHLGGSGAVGPVRRAGNRILLGAEELALVPGDRLDVPAGPTTWTLSYVEPQARAAAAKEDFDWAFPRMVACLLLLAAATIAMFTLEVGFGFTDGDGLSSVPIRYQKIFTQPPPKRLKLPVTAVAKAEAVKEPAPLSTARAPLKAKAAGLLGLLDGLDSARSLFESGMSPGVIGALNNLQGAGPIGDAHGLGGSRGPGAGNGDGLGIGPGGFTRNVVGGGPSAHLTRGPDTGPCCEATRVSEGVSKELIAKVIRRHFAEIKFCYEQGLQQVPELSGKLVVLFVIDASGAVSEAQIAESTLDDASVQACVLARIRHWKFPEPRGGGVVSVTHPWFFRPAGSSD